ncbi:hypothetical protein BDZ94DRAFT_1271988 [Collybia nuda]|uniref:Uncharacterized protein n=1 Tax=Collybia nuda TaxID=64659 RepID=A0A9P5XYB7_9AGAR|nr:hypothetical protein BDZ94DRAFT_1271988 [Collybia nuda]
MSRLSLKSRNYEIHQSKGSHAPPDRSLIANFQRMLSSSRFSLKPDTAIILFI